MPSNATDHAKAVLRRWLAEPTALSRHPVGRINDTWMVGDRYVLQRLNSTIFTDPAAVMRNLNRVLTHDDTLLIAPLPTRNGEPFVIDDQGDLWRVFPRRAGRNFSVLPPSLFRPAAEAFGGFLARLDGFADTLEPVIDGFHQLPGYLAALDAVLAGAGTEVDAERRIIDTMRGSFATPRVDRVIHGDCKVNNLLFHPADDAVVAILDLDTVMLGDPAWDFGDLVRSAFAGAEESASAPPLAERDLAALAQGFAAGFGGVDDIERFAAAPAYMSFMLGVRFLTDHLCGDQYFRVSRHGDNLRRARGQLTLAERFLDAHSVLTAELAVV